jgi:GTPase SAR1 family protein
MDRYKFSNFIETSAKTGQNIQNINELFLTAAKQVYFNNKIINQQQQKTVRYFLNKISIEVEKINRFKVFGRRGRK